MRASAWLERHAEFAQQTVDQYCAQARAARAAPLFEAPGRSRDAAPFLLPLIDWEGATDRAPVFGLLHLPQELSERLSEATADTWPLALADAARGLDYAWMKQALAYDHWDISNDLRFQDQPARWLDATIPNFLSLQHWSKLRLAHGLERGDAAQAAAEVRHLANLCHSTGILLASMVAIALRGLEATAREVAVARGLDVSAWPATTEAQRTNSRKATRNAMYYFLPGVSPEVMKRAAACAIDPCTALAEGLGMHRTLGAYSSRDTTEALNQVIEQSGCTGALVDRARAAAPLEHPSFLNAGQIDQLAQYLDAGW